MTQLQECVSKLLTTKTSFELAVSGDNYVFRAFTGSCASNLFERRLCGDWLGRRSVEALGSCCCSCGGVSAPASSVAFVDDREVARGSVQDLPGARGSSSLGVGHDSSSQDRGSSGSVGVDGGAPHGLCGNINVCGNGASAISGVEVKDGTVSSAVDGLSCGETNGFGSSPKADTRTVNQAKRDKNKQRRARKKAGTSGGGSSEVPEWRRGAGVFGRNGKPRDPDAIGFWKSCDEKTRQELIHSKAAMHIAENKRKAREANAQFDYLGSPQAAVNRAVKLAEKAKVYGMKAGESIVHGYAQTVSTSSAESLVKSLPDSVTSYEDYANRKINEVWSEKLEEVCKDNEKQDKLIKVLQQQLAEKISVAGSSVSSAGATLVESDLRRQLAEKERIISSKPSASDSILAENKRLRTEAAEVAKTVSRLELQVEELEAARVFSLKCQKFPGPKECESVTKNYPYHGNPRGFGLSRWD